MESTSEVFTFRPIGTVHSPYLATRDIPKGWGAKHLAEGTIEILPEYEAGWKRFQPLLESGLGLGLVIARDGVEANGGALRVRDLPGKGCVFTVDLPKAVGAGRLVPVEPGQVPLPHDR